VWSDTAWVFVDYNKDGKMERLPLSGATLSSDPAPSWDGASVTMISGYGAWVAGNARDATTSNGTFTATVQLHTDETVLHGLCVYAINYPPVGQYEAADSIRFTGTPPFYLTFAGDGNATTFTKTPLAPNTYTYKFPDKTLESFTDASRAPGVTKCKMPAAQTLTASAATYCEKPGVTFALDKTEAGVVYLLYKGTTPTGDTLVGTTGGAATFTNAGGGTLTGFGSGTYYVQVRATQAFCAATFTASSVAVTEHPLPTGLTLLSDAICGLPVTVTALATDSTKTIEYSLTAPGATPATWQTAAVYPQYASDAGGADVRYSFSCGMSANMSEQWQTASTFSLPAITFTEGTSKATTYTLHVRTTDGCVATFDTTVVAKPLPAPTLTPTGSICTAITLKATPGPGGTGIKWTDDNYNYNPTTSVRMLVTATAADATTYTAVSTNTTNGCPSGEPATFAVTKPSTPDPDSDTIKDIMGEIGLSKTGGSPAVSCSDTGTAGAIAIDK
jgi:hypothetical protein